MDKPLSGCKESCCSLQRLYDSHPPALEYLNWQGWIYFTLVLDATCRRFRFFEGSEETLLALLTVHVRWFILSGPEVRFWIMQELLRLQGCIFYFCVKCICRRFYFLWRLWFGDAGCWRWCLCLYGGPYFLGQRWNLIVSLCWRFRGGLLVHVLNCFVCSLQDTIAALPCVGEDERVGPQAMAAWSSTSQRLAPEGCFEAKEFTRTSWGHRGAVFETGVCNSILFCYWDISYVFCVSFEPLGMFL